MIIRICYFTEAGKQLMERLFSGWAGVLPEVRSREQDLQEWTGECFARHLPVLFIGACGIAVRSIAPFVKDKLQDSPVLVVDEQGQFVIPVLSGHMGGANELAKTVAERLGAVPVITTATDVEGKFSVDVFARKNGFRIVNREGIRKVSGKLLKGEEITIAIEPGIRFQADRIPGGLKLVEYDTSRVDVRIQNGMHQEELHQEELNQELLLVSRNLVPGMGCKKGKSFEEIRNFIEENELIHSGQDLYALASIDIKAQEAGLMGAAQYYQVPFLTYDAESLRAVEGDFSESAFVEQTTGVSNVCERSAMCCAGEGAVLLQKKTARDGMTMAVARRVPQIITWET